VLILFFLSFLPMIMHVGKAVILAS
jgi:hypothetical protein